MTSPATPPADPVTAVVAKQDITDVLMRYCRAVDRIDAALLRSCYHPDATEDHGGFVGDVDGYVAWVMPLLTKYDMSFHFIGNVLIELLDERRARSEAYGIAHHRSTDGPDHRNLTVGFRYIDDVERRGDGPWLIARRVAVTEWVRRDPPEGWWPWPDQFTASVRGPADPVFAPWGRAGAQPGERPDGHAV
ncbi:MAG: nuclear transport factor 2 family protein [Acidimicrobiales bacterium]|nr:nuclear transport factor 2 family protein [Acidimicrobiales bacterium]